MNKLIDKYVYAVVSKLPVNQKDDISKELYTLIDDMLESDRSDASEESKVEKILLELGDPKLLVEKYKGKKRYLIGPKNFDNYLLVLKIVLLTVLVGITVSKGFELAFSDKNFLNMLVSYLESLYQALLSAFVWVTVIFGVVEYYDYDIEQLAKNEIWNIKKLPEIPGKKAKISLVEPILGIIFSSIFIFVLYFTPEVIAAYISKDDGGYKVIPVFEVDALRGYGSLLIGLFVITIVKEVLKLIQRRWTLKLAIITSVLTLASTLLTLVVFLDQSIWNVHFFDFILPDIVNNPDFSFPSWEQTIYAVMITVVIITIINIIVTLYKGYKYSKK